VGTEWAAMISNVFSTGSSFIDKISGVAEPEVETYYSTKGRSLGDCFPEMGVNRSAEPILWVAHSFFEAKKFPGPWTVRKWAHIDTAGSHKKQKHHEHEVQGSKWGNSKYNGSSHCSAFFLVIFGYPQF